MMGLEASTLSSTLACTKERLTVAKYRITYLAETVFPAPDSPLTITDWFLSSLAEEWEFVVERGVPIPIPLSEIPPIIIYYRGKEHHKHVWCYAAFVNGGGKSEWETHHLRPTCIQEYKCIIIIID